MRLNKVFKIVKIVFFSSKFAFRDTVVRLYFLTFVGYFLFYFGNTHLLCAMLVLLPVCMPRPNLLHLCLVGSVCI